MKQFFTFLFTSVAFFAMSQTNPKSTLEDVTDIDGNVYNTVVIGTQIWLGKNLEVTRLNDGTPIPNITDDTEWGATSTPAYCWFNNNKDTSNGAFYNWYTVNTQKLCPVGWHVPTAKETDLLIEFLGGAEVAGGKLKEKDTANWKSPNIATDDFGYHALPTGLRLHSGNFYLDANLLKIRSIVWSSTEAAAGSPWAYILNNFNTNYEKRNMNSQCGYVVRCLKDVDNGVEELKQQNFKFNIYPNPTGDVLNIIGALTNNNIIQIEIIDEAGKVVKSIQGQHTLISLSELVKGNYFCIIYGVDSKATIPFIKM